MVVPSPTTSGDTEPIHLSYQGPCMLFSLAFIDKKGDNNNLCMFLELWCYLIGSTYISTEHIIVYCSMVSYIVTSLITLGYPNFIFSKECQRGRLLEIFVVIFLGKN